MPAPHTPSTSAADSAADSASGSQSLRSDLLARWPLPESRPVALALLDAWAAPDRGYHDLLHLQEVLDRLDELHPHLEHDAVLVDLAAWFHDAVYDDRPDPEGRSAQWARLALTPLLPEADVDEVARLVLATAEHVSGPDDVNAVALCDADLAILAASPARYADYVAGVRKEYASVPEPAFVDGRATVLRSFLTRDHVFVSAFARAHWEADSRGNVQAELSSLEARVASGGGDPRPEVG